MAKEDRHRQSGMWVALSNPRFDIEERRPIDGSVVDSDENLGDLVQRLQKAGLRSCAIHYVE